MVFLQEYHIFRKLIMATPLTDEDFRLIINDTPQANRLIKKCQFSSERIKKAIQLVLSDWNETPPIVSHYTEETFPYRATLLYGVAALLFAGESAHQSRNHLTYQSGGLTVDDDAEAGAYLNYSRMFDAKYKDLMERQKKAENMEDGFSTIFSGYYCIRN